MRDVECPYCGEELKINRDDGSGDDEDSLHEMTCRKCEKNFVFTAATSVHYEAYKAACLNDGEHQYEKTQTYPPEFARLRCKTCGDEKPLPPNAE